ncbi:signal transduction histidine kinase [Kribbella sp. VKM Ac-2571]|uniref:sensor histidine kinase n=1 Tax=Kribbella sp. VKM Ac-2571 TaxID=2512222 RepID=UPI0010611A90|nr:histidine kinase [Kribbella sp. VKM Ac-2571]TDO68646.1 signal transduction histidine kinase [Kribbella sp. VKM Ac-2571]
MRVRRVLGIVVAGAAAPVAWLLTPELGFANAAPTAVAGCLALAVVVSWPAARTWIAWPGALAAVTSLVASGWILATYGPRPGEAGIAAVEVAGLLVLLGLVARWARPLTAVLVSTALAAAETVWILRFMPKADLLTTVGGAFMWSLGAVVAMIAGSYPRLAAAKLRQSVTSARNSQRLQLAHALHDYIAHDVTGMVAQAQAARFAAADDPAAMRTALERIETTGQEALTAMDTILDMLRDDADPELGVRAVGPKGLSAVVDSFRRESPDRSVILAADESVLSRLAPEVQLAATRVIIEGLTNVRRHAASARLVRVTVEPGPADLLRIDVANDRPGRGRPLLTRRTTGGTGLAALGERVRHLGGRLEGRSDDSGGWILHCELPLTPDGRTGSG